MSIIEFHKQKKNYNKRTHNRTHNAKKHSNKRHNKRKNNKRRKTRHKGGKWSKKYKLSINCKKPKGFSQKQYCKYSRKN